MEMGREGEKKGGGEEGGEANEGTGIVLYNFWMDLHFSQQYKSGDNRRIVVLIIFSQSGEEKKGGKKGEGGREANS